MTDDQPTLPGLAPLEHPEYAPDLTNEQRFELFHAANPHVADALEVLAAEWLAHQDRASIGALFEQLRWQSGIQTTGDPYRLNNNHRAFYTRLLIERRPEWSSRFGTRSAEADRAA